MFLFQNYQELHYKTGLHSEKKIYKNNDKHIFRLFFERCNTNPEVSFIRSFNNMAFEKP